MGDSEHGRLPTFNAPSRLKLGLFDDFTGSHIFHSSNSQYTLYPIAETPSKTESGDYELKVVEIPYGELPSDHPNKSDYNVRYTVSYLKSYSPLDQANAFDEEKAISEYGWTDGIHREVLVHRQEIYQWYNQVTYCESGQKTRVADLLPGESYTISEAGQEFKVSFIERSDDDSFGNDFAIINVNKTK